MGRLCSSQVPFRILLGQFFSFFCWRRCFFRKTCKTGDRRISGTTASLAGLEAAIKARNEKAISLAIEPILLGHALTLGYDGIPLIYTGYELGYLNDYNFADDPEHATDNRWMHRRRSVFTTVEPPGELLLTCEWHSNATRYRLMR